MNLLTKRWFRIHKVQENAKIRLFCFPYAGGNANVFSDWHRHFHGDFEIVAMQPPGRGDRFGEKPINCLSQLVKELADSIPPLLKQPCAFFGHSNGALVAFELARELVRREASFMLERLFIAGSPAPHSRTFDPPLHDLPDEKLKEKLRELNGTPDEVLDHADLLELFLPVLRADFAISETHDFRISPKLPVDLTLIGGNSDLDISENDLLAWGDLVDGKNELFMVDGGHFFVNENQRAVCEIVRKFLDLKPVG